MLFIYVSNKSELKWIIDSPDWKKNKKTTTISPINRRGTKCVQCAASIALNDEEITKDL